MVQTSPSVYGNTMISSGSWAGTLVADPLPEHIRNEFTEYRQLVLMYHKRFEQWPDAEMRETLFKHAIKKGILIDSLYCTTNIPFK